MRPATRVAADQAVGPPVADHLSALESARVAAVDPTELAGLAVRAAASLVVELARADTTHVDALHGRGRRGARRTPAEREAIRRERRMAAHQGDP